MLLQKGQTNNQSALYNLYKIVYMYLLLNPKQELANVLYWNIDA